MIQLLPEYADTPIQPGRGWYDINSVRHERVTTLLNVINKPALVPWAIKTTTAKFRSIMEASVNTTIDPVWINEALAAAKDSADEARDAAAERGNEIHLAIQEFVTHGHWPADGVIKQCVLAYHEWTGSNPMEPVANEFTVWSPSERYAGTIDEVGILPNGHYTVIDFKTGGAYPEHALQVAAYANALEELTGVPVDSAWLLRIPRDQPEDGSPQFFATTMNVEQIQDNYEAFRNAMYLQRRLKGGELWTESK
jgi:hypothetical protein